VPGEGAEGSESTTKVLPVSREVQATVILEGACSRGRIQRVTYVIAEPCVDLLDKACIEECPVDCIYEGARMLYIHPDECVDCGACEPVCPVEAIFYEDDVPDQWKDFYKANVEFFEEIGSPGGASKTGKIDKDHPFVAALPPQVHDEH
jgi:NAD-dependent dihydropyrimidine dehydrogenase PreA subunit